MKSYGLYCCGALSIFALLTSPFSRYFSVSLDCEGRVLHDHHHHHLLVCAGSLLFVTGCGLLGLILVIPFNVDIAFTSTRAFA